MKCSEICALIEQEYSPEYACDWEAGTMWGCWQADGIKK